MWYILQPMTQEQGLVPVNPQHLSNAQREGSLSADAREVIDRPTNTRAVSLAHGTPFSDMVRDPLFVLLLIDNTPSMTELKVHTPTGVVDGIEMAWRAQNRVIDRLKEKSKRPEAIYLSTQILNSLGTMDPENVIVDSYHPLAQAVRLNSENFRSAGGSTPLYDRITQALSASLYETQGARDNRKGQPRTATLIITDGGDNASRFNTAADVAKLTKSMISNTIRRHILAGAGISRNGGEDFRRVFSEMGFPEQWIATADPDGINRIVDLFIEAGAEASSATPEKMLQLTAGGFKGIVPQ